MYSRLLLCLESIFVLPRKIAGERSEHNMPAAWVGKVGNRCYWLTTRDGSWAVLSWPPSSIVAKESN